MPSSNTRIGIYRSRINAKFRKFPKHMRNPAEYLRLRLSEAEKLIFVLKSELKYLEDQRILECRILNAKIDRLTNLVMHGSFSFSDENWPQVEKVSSTRGDVLQYMGQRPLNDGRRTRCVANATAECQLPNPPARYETTYVPDQNTIDDPDEPEDDDLYEDGDELDLAAGTSSLSDGARYLSVANSNSNRSTSNGKCR